MGASMLCFELAARNQAFASTKNYTTKHLLKFNTPSYGVSRQGVLGCAWISGGCRAGGKETHAKRRHASQTEAWDETKGRRGV